MKIKQIFPILVIAGFSCLLSLGATTYLFFATKYPEETSARISLALRQGFVFGIVPFILFLIGVGVSSLLVRIKDASRRKLISLGVYLGSFLLCVVLPGILIVITWFVFTDQRGWQELPASPAAAVQIASAGKEVVIVRSDDGNFYFCWAKQTDKCWEQTDEPADRLFQNYEGEIQSTANPPSITPPEGVIDLVGVVYNQSAIFYESHYAVTSDGHVWYLNRETNNGTAGFVSGLLFIFTLPVMLGTLTVLIGAGIGSGARRIADHIWHDTQAQKPS